MSIPTAAPAFKIPAPADSNQPTFGEARSILLPELPDLPTYKVEQALDRRQSAPSIGPGRSIIHEQILQLREHWKGWGHAWLGSDHADAFVHAVSLRRHSQIDVSSDAGASVKKDIGEHTTLFEGDIVVQVRVWPCDGARKPCIVQRKFNLAKLRATIPGPTPSAPEQDCTRRRPSVAEIASRCPSPAARESHHHQSPMIGYGRRRSTSAMRGPATSSNPTGRPKSRNCRRPSNAMPIHLEYARCYLPVLAALLLSGIIRDGDSIDLPLPRPVAWKETVAYVYGARKEPTEAMRENILYLGGKV